MAGTAPWYVPLIVGWMLGLVTEPVRHWLLMFFRGPRLKKPVVYSLPTKTNGAEVFHTYVSVRIENDKPRIARGCRGYLTRIEHLCGDSNRFIDNTAWQCIWEYDRDRDAFDVAKGVRPSFNVLLFVTGEPGFQLQSRTSKGGLLTAPVPIAEACRENGRFLFHGIVTCDELSAVPFSFETTWNGLTLVVEQRDA